MGTRASFWIGDPRDLDGRQWLGCIAWDGHPDAFTELTAVKTEGEFQSFMAAKIRPRDDFASPEGGWPFPWADDIFLTDCTYAFYGGQVWTEIGRKMLPIKQYLSLDDDEMEAFDNKPEDPSLLGVPAPKPYDRTQPDSIMIFSARSTP